MDLKEIGLVDPEKHWYYIHKSRYIIRKVKNLNYRFTTLIDVGAGSGFFAKEFNKQFSGLNSICVDPFYSDTQIGMKKEISFVRDLPNSSGDIFLFIDVLEHVEDDRKLLNEYIKKSIDNALFIISVPAFASLWSNHDVYLEHYRRYRISDLKVLLNEVGLFEVYSGYIFGTIFPLVWLLRLKKKNSSVVKSDLKPLNPLLNAILIGLLKLENYIPINRFFGTSALIIGQKSK
jgi:hypothetical protein